MKKLLILLVLFQLAFTKGLSQNYETAFGLRGGVSNGITVKHFLGSSSVALEGILATRWKGVHLTGLMEFDNDLNTERLSWYYGFGGHLGFWNNHPNWETSSSAVLGVDGIIGIEYTFSIPFNLSLDYKPGFNLVGYSGFWGDELAFSLRYTIK